MLANQYTKLSEPIKIQRFTGPSYSHFPDYEKTDPERFPGEKDSSFANTGWQFGDSR